MQIKGVRGFMEQPKLYTKDQTCKVKCLVLQKLLHLQNHRNRNMKKQEQRELPRPANVPPPPPKK